MKVEWVRAGDVLTLTRRPVAVEPLAEYREIGVRSFGRGIFHKEQTPGHELGSKRVFAIRSGDLVISNVFAWEGAVAVATRKEDGLIGSHRFMTWTPKVSDVSADYLREYFLSDRGLADIGRASPGSAGRNKTLGINAFEHIQLPLPNLPLQVVIAKRIAVTTVNTDDKITEYTRAFRNQWVSESANDGTRVRAGDVLQLMRRPVQVNSELEYCEIGVRSFGRGIFHKPPTTGLDIGSKRVFTVRARDLIISNVFGWEGAIAVASQEDDGLIGSHRFMTWRPRVADVSVDYLREYFLSDRGLADIVRASPGSAGRNKTLSIKAFENIEIPLPPIHRQSQIGRRLDELSRVTELTARRAQLAVALPKAARNDIFAKLTR